MIGGNEKIRFATGGFPDKRDLFCAVCADDFYKILSAPCADAHADPAVVCEAIHETVLSAAKMVNGGDVR